MPIFLTFEADSASPPAESDVPPGREIADALEHGISQGGVVVVESVDEFESYGWSFTSKVGDIAIWCMLQESDNWLVTVKSHIPILKRMLRAKADSELSKFCTALDEVVQSDSRFRDVTWFDSESAFRSNFGTAQP